jgi:hypothetical protein
MKILLLYCISLPLAGTLSGQTTGTVSAYYYYNPFLGPTVSASYYPTIISPDRINIVTPAAVDLNSVRFPGITINPANLSDPIALKLSSFQSYMDNTNTNFDLVQANHNYIVGKIENDILTGKISNGCTNIARITVEAARKWLPSYCPIAETPPTMAACAIGMALQNSIVRRQTTKIVKKGCTVTVRYISDEIIELSFETYKDLERSAEEAKFWLSFLNSVEGMIWLMNRLQH